MSAGGPPGDPERRKHASPAPAAVSDEAVVALDGDLDIVSSEELKRRLAALVADGAPTITVDLAGVEFVDSSGLGALVAVHQLAEARGSQLVVRSVPSRVQNLLRLTRLDHLLTVEREETSSR